MSYYALFPHTPRVDVDAIAGNFLRLRVLTPMRLKLFRVLIDQGFDFMHSDADAFWLRDPRPWLAEQTGYDLLCSQGTDRPGTQYRTHHIVLCAGFFHCRANARTRALWATVEARSSDYPSDQIRLNNAFLASRGRWEAEQPELAFRVAESRWFRLPLRRALSATMARRLLARRSSRLKRRIRSLKRVDCIVVSDRIIRGRFRDGLTVGVIPMAMVERTEIELPRRGKAPDTDGRSRLLAPVDIHHDLRAARVVAGHRAHRRGELAARKRCAVVLPEPLLREPEARRRRVEGHVRRKPRGPEPRLVLGERVVRALRRRQAECPACSHGSANPYRASAPS